MVLTPLKRGLANTRGRWTFGCLLAMALFGCDDDPEDTTVLSGELGSNQFFYECTTLDDVQCRDNLSTFPDVIAVGASFELLASRSQRLSVFIKPASPHLVSGVAGEFRFVQPGISAFLALHGDDELEDFVHLRAAPVDEIEVQNSFGETVTQVTLARGRELTLLAVPFGDGEELAGSLSFRWATDTESVVGIPRRGTEVILEALEEGTALVRVDLDELSRTIEVTVTPSDAEPPNEQDAGDAAMLDAGLDAGPLDASTDAASEPAQTDAAADAALTPSSTDSTSQTQTTSISDASTPTEASVAIDAQIQAEAGDQ